MSTCVFLLGSTACGDDFGTSISELFPTDFDLTPGCYVEPPARDEPSQTASLLLSVDRSQRDFRFSGAHQHVKILEALIADDPGATHWTRNPREGVELDAALIARAEDWAIAKLVIRADEIDLSTSATIELLPDRVLVDYGVDEVEFGREYVRLGDYIRGCESHTGRSFTVGRDLVDGELVENVARCWSSSTPLDPDPNGVLSSTTAAAEFAVSAEIQCRQLVELVLSR